MFDKLTLVNGTVHVHAGDTTLKTTKAFTNGGITLDQNTRMATFGKLPPVALPAEYTFSEGELSLQLVGPDGKIRPQTRTILVSANKLNPHLFRAPGMSTTPSQFKSEDGWTYEVLKFRCYFTHPGLSTTGSIPQWLKESIDRQKKWWNQMTWLCREARRKCSSVSPEEITTFVQATILPAIDEMNNSLGRSRSKMKHPVKLKVDMPQFDAVWSFVGELRKRVEKSQPVPDGLLEKVVAFAEQFKPDYEPINQFLAKWMEIGNQKATDIELRWYEKRAQVEHFQSLLKSRRTRKMAWTDGWPTIKYDDRPGSDNWTLSYHMTQAGLNSELLEGEGKGVPGLSFGPAQTPASTGHPTMTGSRSRRSLREAHIRIPEGRKISHEFDFGVLQSQPFPENSHVKQWELCYADGKLWLCITIERQHPVPVAGDSAAGLDIGWRRVEEGIRFGVLYEPKTATYRELVLDLQKSPPDHSLCTPFRIDLGPTRWERRNVNKLIPEWKEGDTLPGTFELRRVLSSRRSYLKDEAKTRLRKHLGESLPPWFDTAGRKGLRHLMEDLKDDEITKEIVTTFDQKTEALNNLAAMYMDRATKRLKYGQQQVSHDVCRYLEQKGINRLMVEASFVAKVATNKDGEDEYALKNSQQYRQFAAPASFVATLKSIAKKYGIIVDVVEAINTTRLCQHCQHLNPTTAKESYQCEQCQRLIRQDHNASVNISRFGTTPDVSSLLQDANA